VKDFLKTWGLRVLIALLGYAAGFISPRESAKPTTPKKPRSPFLVVGSDGGDVERFLLFKDPGEPYSDAGQKPR